MNAYDVLVWSVIAGGSLLALLILSFAAFVVLGLFGRRRST